MIMKLLSGFCLMLIGAVTVVEVSSAETCAGRTDVGNIRLLSFKESVYEGVVQICNTYQQQKWWWSRTQRFYTWDYVPTVNWNDTAAQVVCRQLNFPHSTAQSFSVRLDSSEYHVTGLTNCNECNEHLSQCLPHTYGWSREKSHYVAGLNCYCHEGAMRLVGGSTNSEGRVEVCVDGRWGAIKVCQVPDQTEAVASVLCDQLGFSEHNAALLHFENGYGPVYDFIRTLPASDCKPVNTSSNSGCQTYTQSVGVRCQAREDACTTIITDTPTTIEGVEDTSNQSTILNTTSINQPTNESAVADEVCSNDTMGVLTLGALTGLLAAALVAVTMGWIVSCVSWKRRNKQRNYKTNTTTKLNVETLTTQRQLDNPVYGGGTGTHSQTNYSSTGPAYEHVEANEGTGYDVINRRGAPRPHPPMIPPGSHDPTSDQDYSILEGNNYHVLESSNKTGEAESNTRQCQEGSDHNQQEFPLGHDPQDYEIPNSKRSGIH